MPDPTAALRMARAVALIGACALAGTAPAAADPANTGSPTDINKLAASMSKGYGLNNCTAAAITGDQLAVLICGQSPDPGGPVQAKYYLFGSADQLNAFFTANVKEEDTLTACGDSSTKSPSPWHQGTSGNGGQMACGTYQNAAEIIWTNESKNMVGYLRGANADAPALYRWWQANG